MTRQDVINNVAKRMELPVKVVEEIYNVHFKDNVRKNLNNPTFDVFELQGLGTYTITKTKLRSTIRFYIKNLRGIRKKLLTLPDSIQLNNQEKGLVEEIKKLWKLKNDIKL